ncbi:hypothetical protein [Morganella morganii]|uniref:Y-family DNA polymerase n=1 Tax=Morganella morganii TaxID=582 RepID=UPI0031B327F8
MRPATGTYSIDEAFLDFTGMTKTFSLEDYGREIQAAILHKTHLPAGVDIAPTKILAKRTAKAWKKTGRIVDLSEFVSPKKITGIDTGQ